MELKRHTLAGRGVEKHHRAHKLVAFDL